MSIKEKSEKELLEEISGKLDKILGVLTIQGNEEDAQIKILKKLGFQPEEVGKLLGISEKIKDKQAWRKN